MSISPHIRMAIYADNEKIYVPVKMVQDQQVLNANMQLAKNWGDTWKMRFNHSKC